MFALPARLSAKAAPALIGRDQQQFDAIATRLASSTAQLSARLSAALRESPDEGQAALDRDLEIHRLNARLGLLRRFGLDLCLGRMVRADDAEPVYIGRIGLTDADGRRLLVDWRAPAAEPFFAATHGDPMGLVSRRRYRWSLGRIEDYWDEVFSMRGLESTAALDDQSAFIASLGGSRSPRMRDVLSTIQADQDAIIRADSRGPLVVDGGPGTGKTVVALHRAAYLLYSDPRLGDRRGGVLFIGPHEPYLAYVADVLPSLGEEGVLTCTLRDLVPEGASALPESDSEVARLKASAEMEAAIDAAVRHYERPPTSALVVETEFEDVWVDATAWAEAFASPEPGTPHNEARDQIWEQLLAILVDAYDDEDTREPFRRAVQGSEELRRTFARAWPLLDPVGVVADLLSAPGYLRSSAPWLAPHEVQALQRADARAWTIADLPLLDAARHRIGDPEAGRRARERSAVAAAERELMDRVVDDAIASDDSEMAVMSMLRGQDLRNTLADDSAQPPVDPDRLAGPFAHVIVDEAQELTDAEWQMLLRRCPSRSLTIVGDRAQARHGFTRTWQERLARVGLGRVREAGLSINYRTPTEIMAEAEPVIRAVVPDANVPTSVRSSGVPVRHGTAAELDGIVEGWLATHPEGVACVIGAPEVATTDRVSSLSPELAKGLEFDLVVLVDPEAAGGGIEAAVDRYVSMTRATRELVVLTRP